MLLVTLLVELGAGDDAAVVEAVDEVVAFPMFFLSSADAGEKTRDPSDASESYAENCCAKKLWTGWLTSSESLR